MFSLVILSNLVTAQPEIGINVGYNNSKLVGDRPFKSAYRYTKGFLASVQVNLKLSDYVRLSFEPGIKSAGAILAFEDSVLQEYKDSITISNISAIIPVLLKITSLSEKVYFTGGLSLGFPGKIYADNGTEKIDISSEITKINLAAVFGIGYRIPVKSTTLNIELRIEQGLLNISNNLDDSSSYIPRVKSKALQLIIGWYLPVTLKK